MFAGAVCQYERSHAVGVGLDPLKCAFVLLKMNLVLFCATLVCLRPTLASMKSDVSQSKDTRFNQTLLFLSVCHYINWNYSSK